MGTEEIIRLEAQLNMDQPQDDKNSKHINPLTNKVPQPKQHSEMSVMPEDSEPSIGKADEEV